MPIASGASGRVDVGVDTSIRWTPGGLRAQPGIHQHDSYLLQYQELKQMQDKTNIVQSTRLSHHKHDEGAEKEKTQKHEGSQNSTSGPASEGKMTKTSKLCVVL